MKKVLVVGDTILDHYVHGTVSRVNPEASHSVVLDYEKEDIRLGGAANVAANIQSLLWSTGNVHYYGAVSEQIADLFVDIGVAVPGITHPEEEILLKTRYICNGHYLLRVDRGKKYNFSNDFYHNLELKLADHQYDLIIISDYDKGTLQPQLVELLMKTPTKTIFDLKKQRNFPRNVCRKENVIIKCNKSEFESEVTKDLAREVNAIVQTLGPQGASVWTFNDQHSLSATRIEANYSVNVSDVVGAGDAFLAGMALGYIKYDEWNAASLAKYGNICGAAKVQNFGTHILTQEDYDKVCV